MEPLIGEKDETSVFSDGCRCRHRRNRWQEICEGGISLRSIFRAPATIDRIIRCKSSVVGIIGKSKLVPF